jgi:large subunit ribosomal protein L24
MAAKIKKGDTVMIMVGKDRGETGKVLQILPRRNRVLVEGRNMVKKHQRPGGAREAGIIDIEAPLQISNVMVVDPSDNKPCRVGFIVKDGVKQRVSKRTGAVLD